MKNYDIKNATAELSLKQKIVVIKKRLAFLVSNMFSRISKGYNTKVQELKASIDSVRQVAEIEKQAIVKEKLDNIEEKIQVKEDVATQVKQNSEIPDNEKGYIVKAYEDDIESLRNKQTRVSAAPRRLLISKIFLQKLIINKKNKIAEKRMFKKIEKELNNITNIKENMSINNIDDAKNKYIELNNKRLELEDRSNKIKQEMIDLVRQYGLTKDMFEETTEKNKVA